MPRPICMHSKAPALTLPAASKQSSAASPGEAAVLFSGIERRVLRKVARLVRVVEKRNYFQNSLHKKAKLVAQESCATEKSQSHEGLSDVSRRPSSRGTKIAIFHISKGA
jgi:hypothetical protein